MSDTQIHVGDWVRVEGSVFHDLEGKVIGYVNRSAGMEYIVIFDDGTSATFKADELTLLESRTADAA